MEIGAAWLWWLKFRDGLVQDCSISSVLAIEILQFCTKPSIQLCSIESRNVGNVLSLWEAPGAKTRTEGTSIPCHVCVIGGTYSVLLTHDNLCKPTAVKQVVGAAIVILSNVCRDWTMYLCMDSVKFLLEAQGPSILWGRDYFVTIWRPI